MMTVNFKFNRRKQTEDGVAPALAMAAVLTFLVNVAGSLTGSATDPIYATVMTMR